MLSKFSCLAALWNWALVWSLGNLKCRNISLSTRTELIHVHSAGFNHIFLILSRAKKSEISISWKNNMPGYEHNTLDHLIIGQTLSTTPHFLPVISQASPPFSYIIQQVNCPCFTWYGVCACFVPVFFFHKFSLPFFLR